MTLVADPTAPPPSGAVSDFDAEFAALYETATEQLTAALFDSGVADELIDTWSELLTTDAGDLVPDDTVHAEAEAIRAWLEAN